MFTIEYFDNIIFRKKNNRLRADFIKKNYHEFYEYININYKPDNFLEKLYIFYKGEQKKCYCGNKTRFISFSSGYLEYCSKYCSSNDYKTREKYKKTCKDRYGVENISCNDEVKRKKENTFIRKYGLPNYLMTTQSKEIMIEKYGVDNPFKLTEIQDRIKSTNIKKYGYICPLNSPEIKEKTKKSNLERWGVDHFSKTNIWKENMKKENDLSYIRSIDLPKNYEFISRNGFINKLKHINCGNVFEIQTQLIRLRKNKKVEICKVCNKVSYYSENDLLSYISSIYKGEISKYRDKKYEIDIYLPELKLGFEFNGLYWHSELFKNNDYHLNKMNYFKEIGIRIINIWEDDWIFKNEIIKSIISLNINYSDVRKIPARKCIFSEISDKECKKFLNENHLQGWCVSKYRYGLIYDGKIVSILTLGFSRLNLGSKNKKDIIEIIRFCNEKNTKIIGGFSKLFKNIKKVLIFEKLITYSDFSIFLGDVYLNNGFNFIGQTPPGYQYVINGIRKNRFNYNKSHLIKMGFDSNKTEREIMFDNGHYRVYDCGCGKFEYTSQEVID